MSRLYPCVYCAEDGYCKKYSDEEVTSWCVQSPCKDEKPSHADCIRAMTDEELAKLLDNARVSCGGVMGGRNCMADCRKCWLDWLRQEVDDGQN